MEYCKYLKLTNGENIIVTTDNDCKEFKQHKTINIINPVELAVMRISNGPMIMESMTLQPWIKVAPNDVIEVPTESILVITDLKQEAVEQYKTFLIEYEKAMQQRQEQPDVEENHQFDFLENMIEDMVNLEEESEQEIHHEYKRRYKRTIH